MESVKDTPLGIFTAFGKLDDTEQLLVKLTWGVAESAYIPRSNFPVGAAILARNAQGQTKIFSGCNVENRYFGATICAERNAATTAIAQGYKEFVKVVLVCKKAPGGSPCGLCRQVLTEFGCDAVVLNIVDVESNTRKFIGRDLLPAAKGQAVAFQNQAPATKRLVTRLAGILPRSYVPYSKNKRAAIFVASNGSGKKRHFPGVSDDNSSYGGSASAECVAMRTARTAGYAASVALAVTVDDVNGHNPIDGECLQVLREFGLNAQVLLVGPDRAVVHSTIVELLPDSFGPEDLA